MPAPFRSPRYLSVIAILSTTLFAHAATVNYVGPSGNWSLPSNWSINHAPFTGNDVTLSATVTGVTVTLDTGATLGNLTIESTGATDTLLLKSNKFVATSLTLLAGSAINETGGGMVLDGAAGVTHGVAQPAGNGSPAGSLNTSLAVFTSTGGSNSFVGGAGGAGASAGNGGNGGNGGNVILGTGSTILLSPSASFDLRGGRGGAGGLPASGGDGGNAGTLTLDTGSQMTMSGGSLFLQGGAAGTGSTNGSVGAAGFINLNGGSLTTSQSQLLATGGSLAFNAGTLHLTDSSPFFIGDGSITGNALGGVNASLSSGQTLILGGDLNIQGSNNLTLSGGTLQLAGNLTLTGGTLALASTQFASSLQQGGFVFTSGTLNLTDSAPITFSATTLPISNLTLSANQTLGAAVPLTFSSGFTLNLAGGLLQAHQQPLTLSPTAAFSFSNGTIDLSGIQPPVSFPATAGGNGGDFILSQPLTFSAGQAINLAGGTGGSSINGGAGGNGGHLVLNPGANFFFNGGSLNLNGGNGGFGVNTGPSGSPGAIILNGGTLTSPSALLPSFSGAILFNSGAIHLTDASPFTVGNASPVATLLGGANESLTANQTLLLDAPLNIPANTTFTLAGGTLDLSGRALNSSPSQINVTGGTFAFTSGSLIARGGNGSNGNLFAFPAVPASAGAPGASYSFSNLSLTLPNNSLIDLAGGTGGANPVSAAPGGSGGSLALAANTTLTLSTGVRISLVGGHGGADISTLGAGGPGGTMSLLAGSQMTWGGGAVDLSGGAGGLFSIGNVIFEQASSGAPGTFILNGGSLNVDASHALLLGNFQFLTGTLHITGATGFSIGAANTFSTPLTSNATLAFNQSLLVDQTLTLLPNTSLTTAGTLTFGSLNIQSNAYLSLLTPRSIAANITLADGAAIYAPTITLNGGTLVGTGTVYAPVVAGSSSHTISPGLPGSATPATLTLLSLSTNANTTLAFDLASHAATDQLLITAPNRLSLNGGNISLLSAPTGLASLGYYKLIQYAGTLSGNAHSLTLPTSTNPNILYSLDTTRDPNFIDLHIGLLGDANDDGHVDLTDLSTILNNFGTTTSAWTSGNFDNAPTIDLTDLSDVLNNFGLTFANTSQSQITSIPATPTPEPATLAFLAPTSLFLIARLKKSCRKR